MRGLGSVSEDDKEKKQDFNISYEKRLQFRRIYRKSRKLWLVEERLYKRGGHCIYFNRSYKVVRIRTSSYDPAITDGITGDKSLVRVEVLSHEVSEHPSETNVFTMKMESARANIKQALGLVTCAFFIQESKLVSTERNNGCQFYVESTCSSVRIESYCLFITNDFIAGGYLIKGGDGDGNSLVPGDVK
ncbi:hypothetical protein Tco_0591095 [Tanacetum coccineum]